MGRTPRFLSKQKSCLRLPRSSWQQTTVAISRSFWLTISLSRDLLLAQLERSHSLKLFQITEAFPDMKANAYNFHVDPFELNRVWFCTRAVGTHTGTLMGTIQPTNKKVYSPPQMSSVTFNEKGQATHLTAGYVLDRAVGNTEGLGGEFGILHAIGKSPFKFPEGRPWKPSWQYRFFMFLGSFMQKFSKFFSKDE